MVQTECRAPGHPQHREMWAGFQTTGCGSLTRGSGSAISRCWKRARPRACPSPPSSAAGTTRAFRVRVRVRVRVRARVRVRVRVRVKVRVRVRVREAFSSSCHEIALTQPPCALRTRDRERDRTAWQWLGSGPRSSRRAPASGGAARDQHCARSALHEILEMRSCAIRETTTWVDRGLGPRVYPSIYLSIYLSIERLNASRGPPQSQRG